MPRQQQVGHWGPFHLPLSSKQTRQSEATDKAGCPAVNGGGGQKVVGMDMMVQEGEEDA